VLCFLAAQVLLLSLWGHPSVAKAALNLFFGIIVPQAGFHWLMGFVTFMHHTHPKIPWYANRREYSYYRSQVCSTTHIEFPPLLDFVLHRILQHTAHHVDPTIPLYHLLGAQEGLEKRFQEIIHEPFTLRGFLLTLRTCRLYDYQSHRWLDFNCVPTSDTVFAEEAALEGTA
jgi:omega-6 fatty acid desaturase (delta-12 desaturase)